MVSCSFFGQKDCKGLSAGKIREILTELILKWDIDTFYVGNEGLFDAAAHWTLYDLKKTYLQVKCAVVMPYIPENLNENCEDALIPEGIEDVDPQVVLPWRDTWMIKNSDYIFVYFPDQQEHLTEYESMAEMNGKTVVNLNRLT